MQKRDRRTTKAAAVIDERRVHHLMALMEESEGALAEISRPRAAKPPGYSGTSRRPADEMTHSCRADLSTCDAIWHYLLAATMPDSKL